MKLAPGYDKHDTIAGNREIWVITKQAIHYAIIFSEWPFHAALKWAVGGVIWWITYIQRSTFIISSNISARFSL